MIPLVTVLTNCLVKRFPETQESRISTPFLSEVSVELSWEYKGEIH